MNDITRHTLRLGMAVAAAGAFAAGAVAGEPGGAAAVAPQPVPADEMRLVIKDVRILDGSGATLKQWHCEWTAPAEDDAPCMAFSGDPQQAYRAIRDAGGSAATVATRVPDLELDTFGTVSRRGDGTWLFRTEGTVRGEDFYSGWVCSADGRTCTRYEARSAARAERALAAATAKLKKKRRRAK